MTTKRERPPQPPRYTENQKEILRYLDLLRQALKKGYDISISTPHSSPVDEMLEAIIDLCILLAQALNEGSKGRRRNKGLKFLYGPQLRTTKTGKILTQFPDYGESPIGAFSNPDLAKDLTEGSYGEQPKSFFDSLSNPRQVTVKFPPKQYKDPKAAFITKRIATFFIALKNQIPAREAFMAFLEEVSEFIPQKSGKKSNKSKSHFYWRRQRRTRRRSKN
jgi:hypothetical protein